MEQIPTLSPLQSVQDLIVLACTNQTPFVLNATEWTYSTLQKKLRRQDSSCYMNASEIAKSDGLKSVALKFGHVHFLNPRFSDEFVPKVPT